MRFIRTHAPRPPPLRPPLRPPPRRRTFACPPSSAVCAVREILLWAVIRTEVRWAECRQCGANSSCDKTTAQKTVTKNTVYSFTFIQVIGKTWRPLCGQGWPNGIFGLTLKQYRWVMFSYACRLKASSHVRSCIEIAEFYEIMVNKYEYFHLYARGF